MTEWIKVRLTGNVLFKLVGAGIMGLCLVLTVLVLKRSLSEQLLGFLLAGLFLFFLLGYGVFYWANSRYLLANVNTKEIHLCQFLRKEQIYSFHDLTSITILKYTVRLQLGDVWYSFPYEREARDWITFLKTNSSLWKTELEPVSRVHTFTHLVPEPEPTFQKTYSRILNIRQLLWLLMVLFTVILLLNLTRPIIVLVLLCSILGSAFLLHLSDCLLLSRLYTDVLTHGTVLSATISRFAGRTGTHSIPYFTFEDEQGIHEVESLLPMKVTRKEEFDTIGQKYTIWYAPTASSGVLYGSTEPEPLPVRCINLLLLGQMFVALVFFVLLFFTAT